MAIQTKSFVGNCEKKIITDIHAFLSEFKNPILGGFKINSFDNLQVLFKFIKYNVPDIAFMPGRYDSFDAYEVLNGFKSMAKGKLDEYLKAFGIGEKYNGYDGSSVQSLWEEGKWGEIRKYVEGDSRLEHLLNLRILKYMGKRINPEKLLTYDIEVVLPEENMNFNEVLLNEEDAVRLYEEQVRSELVKESAIQNRLKKYSYEAYVKEYEDKKNKVIKDGIFDKFKNKIVAVSFTWGTEDEVDTEADSDKF